MDLKFNRNVGHSGQLQNLTRYSLIDEIGNMVTFSPQDARELAELLQSMTKEIQEDISTNEAIQQPQSESSHQEM
jgi:hypothetical protein